MKKLLILLCLPLIFTSCEKEEEDNNESNNTNNNTPSVLEGVGYLLNGYTYKTTDSGENWTQQGTQSIGYQYGFDFVNEKQVIDYRRMGTCIRQLIQVKVGH